VTETPHSTAPSTRTRLARLLEERLVLEGLPLLREMAHRLRAQLGELVPVEDLLSIGHFALTDLVRRYDPARAPFAAYMRTRLRWAMLDGIRRETHGRALAARAAALSAAGRLQEERRSERLPVSSMPPSEGTHAERLRAVLREHAAALGVALVAVQAGAADTAIAPSSANPERVTLRRDAAITLRQTVQTLEDERQRAIVERHYFRGESLTEVARALGLSTAWVSRLHAQAIRTLEKRLRALLAESSR
jgi:RNA polymerase sigma factor for flagellar operon FliA